MIRTTILGIFILIAIAITSTIAANERICYKCEGINCSRTSLNQTEKCLDNLDICVTIFDNDGVVQNGCLLGLPEKHRLKCQNKRNHPECHKCNENYCNNLNREDFLCVKCDSRSDPKCRTNPEDMALSRCQIGNAPNSYCFIEQSGNDVIRGCSNDIRQQTKCINNSNCMLCMPNDIKGCNRVNFKPGSTRSYFIY